MSTHNFHVIISGQLKKEASIDRNSVSPSRSSVSPSSSSVVLPSTSDEQEGEVPGSRSYKEGSVSPRLSASGRLR